MPNPTLNLPAHFRMSKELYFELCELIAPRTDALVRSVPYYAERNMSLERLAWDILWTTDNRVRADFYAKAYTQHNLDDSHIEAALVHMVQNILGEAGVRRAEWPKRRKYL